MDYNEIEKALRDMKPRQKLFQLVKAEMERRGHWRAKKRGIVFKKGHDERRTVLKPKK